MVWCQCSEHLPVFILDRDAQGEEETPYLLLRITDNDHIEHHDQLIASLPALVETFSSEQA